MNVHCTNPECENGWVICHICVVAKARILRGQGKIKRIFKPGESRQGELPGLIFPIPKPNERASAAF